MKVYSIYDRVADVYNTPFFMESDREAIRAFEDLALDGRSIVSRHPEDFVLQCVSAFDARTGRFVDGAFPHCLVDAETVIARASRGAAVGGETPLKPQSDQSAGVEIPASLSVHEDGLPVSAPVKSHNSPSESEFSK